VRSTRLAAVAAVAALVVIAAGCGGGSKSSNPATTSTAASQSGLHPSSFTDAQYKQAFAKTVVGKTTTSALAQWPKPYQSYHDQYNHRCYEWNDPGHALYNLCFKPSGILAIKVVE
jgi:hypothetical protein